MDVFKSQNILEFSDRFKKDKYFQKYLAEIKWKDGFECVKCGAKDHRLERIFHVPAIYFHIKNLQPLNGASRFGVTQKTARLWKHNVRVTMESICFFKQHKWEAKITNDKWVGYRPIAKAYDIS